MSLSKEEIQQKILSHVESCGGKTEELDVITAISNSSQETAGVIRIYLNNMVYAGMLSRPGNGTIGIPSE